MIQEPEPKKHKRGKAEAKPPQKQPSGSEVDGLQGEVQKASGGHAPSPGGQASNPLDQEDEMQEDEEEEEVITEEEETTVGQETVQQELQVHASCLLLTNLGVDSRTL